MIKAVILDCFGVLVGKGFWHTYDLAGGDSVRDASFIDDLLGQANSGAISGTQFRSAIAKQLGISVERWEEIAKKEEQPNIALLEYIRDELKPKYKIGFISNVNHGVVDRKISKKWQTIFDDMIISAEVGLLKPDPEIFKLAANNLRVKCEEAVFIDDLQKYLDGARSVGMKTVHYTDFQSFKIDLDTLKSDELEKL